MYICIYKLAALVSNYIVLRRICKNKTDDTQMAGHTQKEHLLNTYRSGVGSK